MYIREIRIENIRGFRGGDRKVHLDLCRPDGTLAGWTVIAGRNGAGKSTLLKAIALCIVGPGSARSLEESFGGWLRAEEKYGYMAVSLERDAFDKFTGAGNVGAGPFWADLLLLRQPEGPEPKLIAGDPRERGQNAERGPWADNPAGWFLAGYGPFRRLLGHASDAVRLMVGPARLARVVSLFREDASLVESTQWLKNDVYLRRLENKPGALELEQNVLALLNDGLLPEGVRITGVDSEGLWTDREGLHLPLREMSDGYRTVTALVLDIIKQIHQCHGEFEISQAAGRVVVPYHGVVLIDEVDVHLHVSWQQRIGFWLKEHFPRIQFIVTTHSPFICQAADPRGLIRLPAPGEDAPAAHVSEDLFNIIVNGGADDAALTALFGMERTYSARAEELRSRVAELEAKVARGEATPEEREELARKSDQLPSTGSAMVEQALRKLEALEP